MRVSWLGNLGLWMAVVVAAAAPAAHAGKGTPREEKKLLRVYDGNDDDKLDERERAEIKGDRQARRAHRLQRFDADHDGKLSGPERAVAKEAKRQHHLGKKQEKLMRFDSNKDGKLDEAEKAAAKRARHAAFDGNKDGKLDAQENAARRAEQRARLRGER